MTTENALDVVQGAATIALIVLLALGIRWNLRANQDLQRRNEDLLELEHNVHDWNCDSGPWPHAGECTLETDDIGRYLALARCAAVGVGRLGPEFVTSVPPRWPDLPSVNLPAPYDAPLPDHLLHPEDKRYNPKYARDERCEGAGT